MNWYCKFCRLFTQVDYDSVCNTCNYLKKHEKRLKEIDEEFEEISEEFLEES